MRFAALSFICLAVTSLAATPALLADYNSQSEKISDMNRNNPLQSPQLDKSADILGRRMLDRKNKVVGSIQDIVLNENGNIAYLNVKFDRMQLSRPVFVNYSRFNVSTVSNGYAMTMNDDEIEALYPELLADIETAAGEDDTYSLRKLQGMKVSTLAGRDIGTIEDVLFGANGKRAEAIYVKMSSGNLRGKGVAIPFGEVDFANSAMTRQASITEDTARAMSDVAKAQ